MLRCERCRQLATTPDDAVTTPDGVRHCSWLDDDGVICDVVLPGPDDLFCAHHPGASVTPITGDVVIGGGVIRFTPPPPNPGRRLGELEASHLVALTAINRHDKPDGLLVLYLARQLDDGQAGTAVAAISGRLMSAAQVAYAGAPPEPGELDRLRSRRAQRIAALSGMDEGAGDA